MKRLLVFGALTFSCSIAANADEVLLIPDIAPISDAAIRAPLVVEKIKKGELTAEEAWQKGELNEETLLFLLNQEGGDRGSLNLVDKANLSDVLIEVMIRHLPEHVAKPELVGEGVRFRLGTYYFEKNDPRSVDLLEGLIQPALKNKNRAWFFPIAATLLGEWYQSRGQVGKSIAAFSLLTQDGVNSAYADNASVELARLYASIGDDKSAAKFYERGQASKNDWAKSIALSDQMSRLMAQQRFDETERMLDKALVEAKSPKEQIAVHSLKTNFYYRRGNFEKAQQHAESALAESSKLNLDRDDKFLLFVLGAQQSLGWIKRWQQTPLIVAPDRLEFSTKASEPRRQILTVKTPGWKTFEVKSDDKRVRASLLVGAASERQFWLQREVAIEIEKGLDAPLESAVLFYVPDKKESIAKVLVRVTNASSNSVAP
jgi:tetratricopeptide (TPR) repeat protein